MCQELTCNSHGITYDPTLDKQLLYARHVGEKANWIVKTLLETKSMHLLRIICSRTIYRCGTK